MKTLCVSVLLLAAGGAEAAHEWTDRNVDQGKALYADHCAACHGANLEGQPEWNIRNPDGTMPAPPHDETGHTWHHDSQMLFDYTKMGGQGYLDSVGVSFQSAMPGFDGVLSDAQIWDILGYIRSTWPARVQEVQAARTQPHQ